MSQSIFPVVRLYKTSTGEIVLYTQAQTGKSDVRPISLQDVLQIRDDASRILTNSCPPILHQTGKKSNLFGRFIPDIDPDE